ncbi:hypothetical protein [Bradyrhizobium sp. WSM1253]|uniref:hypothetical protein n=1 Tax=Bradyrhizobium sp. WSM1253 TaxID=319003 RepID=UPI0012F5087B|nr:hypothetical protein [Bradyrhizobium sp. WSM1253]
MVDDVHRIELRAKSIEQLRSFLDGADVDLGCRPVARKVGGEYVAEIYAPLPTVERLRSTRSAAGITIKVVENASEVGRARQAEVGSGNRFAARITPRGLGIKE